MLSELAAELRAARDEHHRDVAQLRTDLTGLSTLLGENADLLGQVLPRVSDLDGELADLADRVDALAAPTAEPAAQKAPADWPSLSTDDAAKEWQALADWIASVLGPFHELTRGQLPDCWARHRPAVLELVWLRRTYIAAHRPDAAPTAVAEWHTRWRRDALANIAAAIPDTWCRPGEHYVDRYNRSPRPAGPPAPGARPQQHLTGQRPGPGDNRLGEVGEITTPQHWGPGYQTARDADLAWRRHRDAAAATAAGE